MSKFPLILPSVCLPLLSLSVRVLDLGAVVCPVASHHIKSGKAGSADKADARQRHAIFRDAMSNSSRLLGRKAIPGLLRVSENDW